ncbi:DUF4136 domain-containing protein [Psychromonas sp. RZ22]|uniref:DUF4136 domain-containing protein n=1 Tax=Psychromonas algarum TaxID=2555643 RepID=UPI001068343F|nr:DUF4136 domain-containing protein [Psychromonas sp. RZ22]TEW53546.1 DUF4136 domain-containing protein [Psychromonas sp. RZ22]
MKKNCFLMTFFVALQFLLVACSSQDANMEKEVKKAQEQSEVHRLTVVSSGKPAEVLPAFTTYTWSEQYNRVLSGLAGHNEKELQTYIRSQITEYLRTKGYQYRENPKQADVVIGFLFALEDDVADQSIQEKFGLLPGLSRSHVNDPRYEKGTLLLAVLDNQQKEIYWRSAVQGFLDLKDDKMNSSGSRMQGILNMMLGDFPGAGN